MKSIILLLAAGLSAAPAYAERTRTNPEVLPQITSDRVMQFGVVMAYDVDGTPNTEAIKFEYVINAHDSGGNVARSQQRVIPFVEWPGPVKTNLKAIYSRILIDAENQGLIGAGTDTDDLP